jgi:hypothetical protein
MIPQYSYTGVYRGCEVDNTSRRSCLLFWDDGFVLRQPCHLSCISANVSFRWLLRVSASHFCRPRMRDLCALPSSIWKVVPDNTIMVVVSRYVIPASLGYRCYRLDENAVPVYMNPCPVIQMFHSES